MLHNRMMLLGVATMVAGVGWFGADAANAGGNRAPAAGAAASARALPGPPAASVAAAASRAADPAAPAGQTVILLARQVEGSDIDVGPVGSSPGDFSVNTGTLYDSTGRRAVGVFSSRCEQGIRSFTCEATARITSKGKIRIEGTVFDESDNTFPVTGGTGAYQSVGGQLTVFDLQKADSVLVFHLVR